MKKEPVTPGHPDWETFADRLAGPEGCDFKDEPGRGPTWKCKGGMDKTFAIAILLDMGYDPSASIAYFEDHGGHCDCEILFNVSHRYEGMWMGR